MNKSINQSINPYMRHSKQQPLNTQQLTLENGAVLMEI